MKVILITLSDILPTVITHILSPELEYSAIVVDEIEPAKNFMKNSNRSENLIHAFVNLKECVEGFHYDCIICFSDERLVWNVSDAFKYHGVPKNKLVHLFFAMSVNNPFILERNIRYFKEHAAEFDMISLGASTISVGLDATQFENHKLFNFGRSGNDLYYDYQTAKFVLNICRGGVY